MNLLLAAMTGWGKSYTAQAWIEENLDDYDRVIVLDYKQEYGGLLEAFDPLKRVIVGPNEVGKSVKWWYGVLKANRGLVLPRYQLKPADWRDVVGTIVSAARAFDGSVLVAIDEAQVVAPQQGGYPEPVKLLATTGRGELTSSMWITQRLAELDETIVTQCTARLVGGFGVRSDRQKIGRAVGYPPDVHNPDAGQVHDLPESLHAEEGALPVRKFTDGGGDVYGSEWIYSDDQGERRRYDTRNLQMYSEHIGPQGKTISPPSFDSESP